MSSNKRIKDKMIKEFGKKCFIEELHLRKKEDVEKDIKRYKSKCQRKMMDMLTYHHIIEKCRDGKATIENGAILRNINHIWFHRLPKEQQAKINKLFQEYKKQFYEKAEVEMVDTLDTGIELNFVELEIAGTIKIKKIEYNRAKLKRETQKAVEEIGL